MNPQIHLLTDAQFALLLGALGSIATSTVVAFRWAIIRIVRSIDANTDERMRQREAFAAMRAQLDELHGHVARPGIGHAHTIHR